MRTGVRGVCVHLRRTHRQETVDEVFNGSMFGGRKWAYMRRVSLIEPYRTGE